jgi:flagellar biosynthesis protein FlhF
MRIKRFTAPDMRTALRMVRDEQGPDAVILSNRATADGTGIEVVAATDYDEALVAQALRAAAPGIDTAPAAMPDRVAVPAPRATAEAVPASATVGSPAAVAPPSDGNPAPPRESLISRARAVFKPADGPTLAELAAAMPPLAPTAMPRAPAAPAAGPSRFDAMMAALDAPPARASTGEATASASGAAAFTPVLPEFLSPSRMADTVACDADTDAAASDAPEPPPMPAVEAPAETLPATPAPASPARLLQAVEAPEADLALDAMRADMARMREMMEAQMEQLSLERLRGSPARAAVFEALLGHGCEEALAQAVAARIDPRLAPGEVEAPMLAELARMLTIARAEPLDDGGVIALVGPTGAGKTTTAAKLAARFAARHRARDVALVTTDGERPGAREQLHAHGRRLGITVCEAQGPEGLHDALAQLVDYPLVLVDTTGHAPRDRALFSQILWLRAARRVRSLLVLPANAHPHDLGEVIRRYRPAAPEGVVLTKIDETGRLGSALSIAVRHGLSLAYTSQGQQVPSDLDAADASRLVQLLEKSPRAADNAPATEDRHAVA